MIIDDILAPSDVLVGLRATGKRSLIEILSQRAARACAIDPADLLAALLHREGLGSTGIGDGVALPHARLEPVRRPYGILARLRDPIDFEAVDERKVDLVVLLLLPSEPQDAPLNALACVARRLRDPATAAAMRRARDPATLFGLVRGPVPAGP